MKQEKKEYLYLQLGKLTMQVGKQAQICNKEQKKLQDLQVESNRIATEIEKLDG